MAIFFTPDLIMNINGVMKTHLQAIARSATVASGNAVFYLTDDNTAAGAPIFANVYLDSVMFRAVEVDSPHSFGPPVVSVDKKTLTVPVKKTTGVNVALIGLTVLGAPAAANGSVISAFIVGN